ncbi:PREDICTED: nucleolar protein 58-like [Camelina sativa]|uniref:Nucleolar protein 58-like n=1 Tax=Camelina sativa TaxID=90675 RepID=A0ABM0SVX9_CAMSA|nr:PREDICTED: nucleolar protein 58-like [Camelina sativa]
MDSPSTQKTKPRKMKVVVKKSRAQILLDLLYRVIEITIVMVTVAKLFYQLVITFEGSGLAGLLISRHLAFVLGNGIVIALVANCGFFLNQEPDARRNSNDFYDEFVRESSRGVRNLETQLVCREKQSEAETVAKQSIEENRAKQSIEDKKRQSRAKQSIEEKRTKQSTEDKREKQKKTENCSKQNTGEETEKKDITVKRHKEIIAQNQESPRKSYERSQSENLEGSKKSTCGKLKRSETERSADVLESDDELRYKIESFIARQRRNQKDEEFCIT